MGQSKIVKYLKEADAGKAFFESFDKISEILIVIRGLSLLPPDSRIYLTG